MLKSLIVSAVLFFAIAAAALSEIYARKAHIPPVPTMPSARAAILKALTKHLDPAGLYKIAELGSGWGGLVFALAKTYPEAEIHGFEMAPLPYAISKIRAFLSRRRNIVLSRTDFFMQDLKNFDAIVCYLSPWHMEKLGQDLSRFKPGAILVSNAFPIPGRVPVETIALANFGVRTNVYIYVTA